jgi:hypothetical protein
LEQRLASDGEPETADGAVADVGLRCQEVDRGSRIRCGLPPEVVRIALGGALAPGVEQEHAVAVRHQHPRMLGDVTGLQEDRSTVARWHVPTGEHHTIMGADADRPVRMTQVDRAGRPGGHANGNDGRAEREDHQRNHREGRQRPADAPARGPPPRSRPLTGTPEVDGTRHRRDGPRRQQQHPGEVTTTQPAGHDAGQRQTASRARDGARGQQQRPLRQRSQTRERPRRQRCHSDWQQATAQVVHTTGTGVQQHERAADHVQRGDEHRDPEHARHR